MAAVSTCASRCVCAPNLFFRRFISLYFRDPARRSVQRRPRFDVVASYVPITDAAEVLYAFVGDATAASAALVKAASAGGDLSASQISSRSEEMH